MIRADLELVLDARGPSLTNPIYTRAFEFLSWRILGYNEIPAIALI